MVHTLNPLADNRWDDLVARHPKASIFHHRGWLEALARTYGYTPLVLTSTPPGVALKDGIALCRVSSWLTGTRLVSLPFADHCEPLLDTDSNFMEFAQWMRTECDRQRWKYVELRPLSESCDLDCDLASSKSYYFHELDLMPVLSQIFQRFHKTSLQQKIRRAEKMRLTYELGRTENLLEEFYGLLVKTRKRHQLFPQPRTWFTNLIECLGDNVQIRVARKDGSAVAALLTLRHRFSVVYKYGCSDENFHNLGGMPLLLWMFIQESKAAGATQLDFGRSDTDNEGLVAFKDRFGSTRKALTYLRYPQVQKEATGDSWFVKTAKHVFSMMPNTISPVAGSILYRHIG